MAESPRRRLFDRVERSLSLLVEGSRVVGDVEVPGALAAYGEVVGDGHIGGELSIGPKAHWQGEVHAASAIIAGRLTGSILVREKIEIGARAVIHGRVTARQIAMARGATVDGEVHATGGEPILEFEERRGAPPGQDEPA